MTLGLAIALSVMEHLESEEMGYFSIPKENTPKARLENAIVNLKLYLKSEKDDFRYLISMAKSDIEEAFKLMDKTDGRQ